MEYKRLSECAFFSSLRTKNITLDNYITTDNMLPNKGGIVRAESLPDAKTASKYEPGDILLSNIRPYFCKIWFADKEGSCSNDVLVIKAKKGWLPKFIYYVLSDQNFFNYDTATSKGTKMPRGTKNAIMKYFVPDVGPSEQQKIVDILSKYDNLIETNKKRIQNLEEQASELYKEWFVRFRYPGWEEFHLENGIPKGWEIKRLSDVANIIMGQSPSSDNYNLEKQGLPFHQGVSSYGKFYLIDDVYSTGGNRIGKPFSIIFSVRAPVGRLNITLNRVILGRGVAAINAKNGNNAFLFWALKAKFSQEDMIGNGSIFSSVTKPELSKQRLLIPPKSLEDSFNHISSTIEKEIRVLTFANTNLTEQKDLLLIRLLHNEIGL